MINYGYTFYGHLMAINIIFNEDELNLKALYMPTAAVVVLLFNGPVKNVSVISSQQQVGGKKHDENAYTLELASKSKSQ